MASVNQAKVDEFVTKLAEGGLDEAAIRESVLENQALFLEQDAPEEVETPGFLSRTLSRTRAELKRGATIAATLGLEASRQAQGMGQLSRPSQPTLSSLITGEQPEPELPLGELAIGLPLLNPSTALPTAIGRLAANATAEAGGGPVSQIASDILAGIGTGTLGLMALRRLTAAPAAIAATRQPRALLGASPLAQQGRVFIAGESSPRVLQEAVSGPVGFRPSGTPRLQGAGAPATIEASFDRNLSTTVRPRDYVDEFVTPARQAVAESERVAALAGEPTGILSRSRTSATGVRSVETYGGIRARAMADIESPPVPVQEVPYAPRQLAQLKNAPLSEQVAQISRRIAQGDPFSDVMLDARKAGLKRAAKITQVARFQITQFSEDFSRTLGSSVADANTVGRAIAATAYDAASSPAVKSSAAGSTIRNTLGKFVNPAVLYDTPLMRPFLRTWVHADSARLAEASVFEREMKTILKPLTKTERAAVRYVNETQATDDVLAAVGIKPERIPILRTISGRFRDLQNRVARSAGYDPDLGIANYFSRMYKYPKHFEDETAKLADELGVAKDQLRGVFDNEVPSQVVAKNLLPRTAINALDETVDDAALVGRAYIRQLMRRKYFDPLVKQYDDSFLLQVAGQEGDEMARRTQRTVFDFMGMPYKSDVTIGRALTRVAGSLDAMIPDRLQQVVFRRQLFNELAEMQPHAASGALANIVTTAQFVGKLGFNVVSLLNNSTQAVFTISEAGFRASARGAGDAVIALLHNGKMRAALRESGVLAERASRETGLWGGGLQKLLRLPTIPFEMSEVGLRSFSQLAFRRAALRKSADPRFLSDDAVINVLKTQFGFSKPLRPEVLRSTPGRIAGQFQSFTLGAVSLLGDQVRRLVLKRDPAFIRTMAVSIGLTSVLSNTEVGQRVAGNIGLGWLPFVGYDRRNGRFFMRGIGETLAGPTVRDIGRAAQTITAIWRRAGEEGPEAVSDEISKLLLSLSPALKRAVQGETVSEKLLGPEVNE